MPHTKRKCDNNISNLLVVSENTHTTLLLLAYAVLVIINKQISKRLNSKPFWVEAKEFWILHSLEVVNIETDLPEFLALITCDNVSAFASNGKSRHGLRQKKWKKCVNNLCVNYTVLKHDIVSDLYGGPEVSKKYFFNKKSF